MAYRSFVFEWINHKRGVQPNSENQVARRNSEFGPDRYGQERFHDKRTECHLRFPSIGNSRLVDKCALNGRFAGLELRSDCFS